MSVSNNIKRVLIVQDASKELSNTFVRHVLQILKLKRGDKLKLLGIIQAFTKKSQSNPGCSLIFKEKTRLHSGSATTKKYNKDIKEEIEKTRNLYLSCADYKEISKITEQLQVEFEIAIEVGLLNEVAVEYAKVYHATEVILHRKLKKEVKYFTQNLPCGISRMKLDYTIEVIRPTKFDADHITSDLNFRRNDHDPLRTSSCSLCINTRPRVGETKIFTFAELQRATNGFSEQKLMPDYGKKVYFGILNNHRRCLIREQPSNTIKEEDFRREVCILEKVGYENVALLLGYCTKGQRRFLVYEYICSVSLGRHLSRKNKVLTWEMRMNIALGAANSLENLHRRSVYGSMRPNNIIITHDFQPFISFYGFATNQYEALGHTSDMTVLKTFEYLSPEYAETGIDLSKADVYSFGVVLLELITGRKTIEDTDGQSFLRWARPLLQQKSYMELIDPAIQGTADLQQLYWLVPIVERCLNLDPESRYPMIRVVKALWDIINQSGIRNFTPTEF